MTVIKIKDTGLEETDNLIALNKYMKVLNNHG
jgi:hypothetical protein